MQEMQPPPWAESQANLKEYFTAAKETELRAAMDKRRGQLESKGYTFVRRRKIGRNEPCPCGSGVKFKKCHLYNVEALNLGSTASAGEKP